MEKYLELYTEGMTQEQFTEIITKVSQASSDKVRTEYSAKLKEVESKLPKEKSESELQLEQKLSDIAKMEKQLKAKEFCLSNGLDSKLADYFNLDNEDLSPLVDYFNQSKKDNSYKPTSHKENQVITKEQFKNMSYSERSKLAETNIELYNSLSK